MEQGRIRLKDVQFDCIVGILKGFIRLSCFKLVETLVVKTAEYVLEHYPKATAVEVSVAKPKAIPGCLGAEASIKLIRD